MILRNTGHVVSIWGSIFRRANLGRQLAGCGVNCQIKAGVQGTTMCLSGARKRLLRPTEVAGRDRGGEKEFGGALEPAKGPEGCYPLSNRMLTTAGRHMPSSRLSRSVFPFRDSALGHPAGHRPEVF